MRISVTKRELQSILSSHFKTNVTEVEIDGGNPDIVSMLKQKIGLVIDPVNKIQSIKELRTITAIDPKIFNYVLGLAEAKWAVENWARFLNFVEKNGRIPHSGFSNGILS